MTDYNPRPFAELTKDFTPERKARIREQSAKIAAAMAKADDFIKQQNPAVFDYIMTDEELENELTESYERGEITLKLTEDEVGFLNQCLDTIGEFYDFDEFSDTDKLFESIEQKITDLYDHNCVKYELSHALKAYQEKYKSWGTGDDAERWEGFRDAYNMLSGDAQ